MTKELQRMFPEGAEFVVRKDKRPECSDTMKWQLNGKRASRFLKEVLPFMRVKHEQAKLAIEFQETTKKHWKHMEDRDYEEQARLCQSLKDAKQELRLGKLT